MKSKSRIKDLVASNTAEVDKVVRRLKAEIAELGRQMERPGSAADLLEAQRLIDSKRDSLERLQFGGLR